MERAAAPAAGSSFITSCHSNAEGPPRSTTSRSSAKPITPCSPNETTVASTFGPGSLRLATSGLGLQPNARRRTKATFQPAIIQSARRDKRDLLSRMRATAHPAIVQLELRANQSEHIQMSATPEPVIVSPSRAAVCAAKSPLRMTTRARHHSKEKRRGCFGNLESDSADDRAGLRRPAGCKHRRDGHSRYAFAVH